MRSIRKVFSSQINFRFKWRNFILLTIGALILAANLNIFLAPSNLAPGGVMGIAVIVNEFTGWPLGLIMLVLNIPLLVLGFYNLGRFNFLINTSYVVLVYRRIRERRRSSDSCGRVELWRGDTDHRLQLGP